jgi:hypothetical protein
MIGKPVSRDTQPVMLRLEILWHGGQRLGVHIQDVCVMGGPVERSCRRDFGLVQTPSRDAERRARP